MNTNITDTRKKPLVIYGTGKIASVVADYIQADDEYEICAFVVQSEFMTSDQFKHKPVVHYDQLVTLYPPSDFSILVAVGYHNMNSERETLFNEIKSMGYDMAKYVHPSVVCLDESQIAPGCIIFDHVSVQPGAKIAENTYVWSNCVIAHGSEIKPHCWIAAGCVVAGDAVISHNCFLGVNSTVGHNVVLGQATFVGANTLVSKHTDDDTTIISAEGEKVRLDSRRFMKFAKL